MALLVKGDEVSFLRAEDKKEILLPPRLCIVHDLNGELIRTCDIFIVGIDMKRSGMSHSDRMMRKAATEYFGSNSPLCEVVVDLPLDRWQHVADVIAIRYRRLGYLGADYEHFYSDSQPLYAHRGRRAWKVVHGDGCIANARGFVHP